MDSRISLKKYLWLFSVSFIFSAGFVFANEASHGEVKKEAQESGHGASADGHAAAPAEGGGHGPAAPVAAPPPWLEVETRISNLDTQMKMKQANIKKLFDDKNHLPNGSPQLKQTISELVAEHKELKRISEELEKQKIILKYRFPERSLKVERTYKKQDLKSLEEMEKQLGIEGQLDRSVSVLRKHYATPEKSGGSDGKDRSQKKTTPATPSISKEKPVDQQGSILLQK